jgi:hypothetical protein
MARQVFAHTELSLQNAEANRDSFLYQSGNACDWPPVARDHDIFSSRRQIDQAREMSHRLSDIDDSHETSGTG